MDYTVQDLSRWLATLPLFQGIEPDVTPFSSGPGTMHYLAVWNSERAVLKLFADLGAAFLRAKYRANAEAEGLRAFAPLGLAPELLANGELPAGIGGSFVLYKWLNGNRFNQVSIGAFEADLCADTLWAVHSTQLDLKLVSPRPRNLDAWWLATHERYRELQWGPHQQLPPIVQDGLDKLVQSVAADAQAHKRFWQGVPLSPVHGTPSPENLIEEGTQAMLVNWQRFGLGDPAYEVVYAAYGLTQRGGADTGQHLIASYAQKAQDPQLETRMELYWRLSALRHCYQPPGEASKGVAKQGFQLRGSGGSQ